MVADVAFASGMVGRGLAFLESVGTGQPVMAGKLTVNGTEYRRVDFRVSMPGWVAGSGGWSVQLTGGGKTLFSESDNAPGGRTIISSVARKGTTCTTGGKPG